MIVYGLWTSDVQDPFVLGQGLTMLILACWPALQCARKPVHQFPAFEAFMLTGINTYALPLLTTNSNLQGYSLEVVQNSAWGVILFQLCAIGAYAMVQGRPMRGPTWTKEIFSRDAVSYLRYGMILTTVYTFIYSFTDWVPDSVGSVLRAAFFGVGILCTFLISQSWGCGTLKSYDKAVFLVTTGVQAIILCVSLLLVGAVTLILLAFLGYVAGARRLPVPVILLALGIFSVFAVLHNGKDAMRRKYWDNFLPTPSFFEVPGFYAEWIGYGMAPPAETTDPDADANAGNKLLNRTSLFHMVCLVVANSPDKLPFLDGDTYGDILPQLIPRFLWPGKPLGHVSTYRLSIYYGLQDENATEKTTIAFGIVAEAYANFGFFGLGILGFLLGAAAKLLTRWTINSPILSYPGLFMVLLMAWSVQTELPVSAWIASLEQASVAVIGLPFFLKKIAG